MPALATKQIADHLASASQAHNFCNAQTQFGLTKLGPGLATIPSKM